MTTTRNKISWGRFAAVGASFVSSVVVGFIGQPYFAGGSEMAMLVVVLSFSIFAGFVIFAMFMTPVPVLARVENWKELLHMRPTVEQQLMRHVITFHLYLIASGLAVLIVLAPPEMVTVVPYVQTAFLSVGTFAFLLSFSVPVSLRRIKMEQYNAELDAALPKAIRDAIRGAENEERSSGH